MARRLGRIFAHAYFHHREAFEQAEVESSLYARFLALTARFDLVPPEFLVIPPVRAADDPGRGSHTERDREGRGDGEAQPPRLLAAALDPSGQGVLSKVGDSNIQHPAEQVDEKEGDRKAQTEEVGQWGRWTNSGPIERRKSHSPPGLGRGIASGNRSGSESPRRIGRNRTDTMVYSDATAFAERVAEVVVKSEPQPEAKEVVPPSPSESDDVEHGGTEPAPAAESEPEAESTTSPPAESPPQLDPESEPAPQPEPEPEPEAETAPPDVHTDAAESAAEDAAAASSEAETPMEDADPNSHMTDTEAEAEDETVEPEPTPADGEDETAPIAETEPEPEPEPEVEVEAETTEGESAQATDTEVSASEAEAEAGPESEEDVSVDAGEDADTTASEADGEGEGEDFVPVDKVDAEPEVVEHPVEGAEEP